MVKGREDVVGLFPAGSCARDTARPDSGVDFVPPTTDESRYLVEAARASDLGLGAPIFTRPWGAIAERRCSTALGLEIELGIGSPARTRTDPVEHRTRSVATDGASVPHGPTGLLAAR
ncbi:nucleotidyltransferase domain-containing protein [Streptomyces sp. TG1A-8]|uniref:nucleotidyltransferase domain-containing protein n=1 Tax=Streptomyces sp. TG1A-8 TaxID=3051385 RepID=UPI00265B8413|nr:nucleotidyltransferase domain-containing protein [Streptomyces sp. TG1A-8]MDO0929483.1 nucleotidyltransferase domain-containing protein [Streptomyces sp. TG1A-8]